MNVDEATKEVLLQQFSHRWTPFAFQVTWQPPQDDNERSKVFRAHWRRIYRCAVRAVYAVRARETAALPG